MNDLIKNIEKVHTTEMGVDRIKKNIGLENIDVVEWCKKQILSEEAKIYREGKNWYVELNGNIITVNSYSYTIITAHKLKKI